MPSGSYATKAGFREDFKPTRTVATRPSAASEPRGPRHLLAGLCCTCGTATTQRDGQGHPRHAAEAADA